jgi:hypothetical protein
MNKKTSEIIGLVEEYLREAANTPLEEKPCPYSLFHPA